MGTFAFYDLNLQEGVQSTLYKPLEVKLYFQAQKREYIRYPELLLLSRSALVLQTKWESSFLAYSDNTLVLNPNVPGSIRGWITRNCEFIGAVIPRDNDWYKVSGERDVCPLKFSGSRGLLGFLSSGRTPM